MPLAQTLVAWERPAPAQAPARPRALWWLLGALTLLGLLL